MPVPNSLSAREKTFAEWRRDLHRHPELAFEEHRTAGIVAERLRAFGCDRIETGVGGTGVVATIHGRNGPGPEARAVLLRADMDALPMDEATGLPHASVVPGRMHACGHDGHTTMLLAAAQHLAETRAFDGSAHLCFQPAEEAGGGARAMIADGLFERFPTREVHALHILPGRPLGTLSTRPGPILGANRDFTLSVEGEGGHAAYPDLATDQIVAAAHLASVLQAIVARRLDPRAAAVVSLTAIEGGAAFNVLPARVALKGTIRVLDDALLDRIWAEIERTAAGVATAHAVRVALTPHDEGYPVTVNDPQATAFAREVAADVMGAANVLDVAPELGVEDFSYMLQHRPGAFAYLGNGDTAALHHPAFDFDDRATPYGAAYLIRLVERALPL